MQGVASGAAPELQAIWARIDFVGDWTVAEGQVLLAALTEAESKKDQKFKPERLLESFASEEGPRCVFAYIGKKNRKVEGDPNEPCSFCTRYSKPCCQISLVESAGSSDQAAGNVRWRLTKRQTPSD